MDLPEHLTRKIKDGNICLVLGAGCSLTSTNGNREKIPSAGKFCEIVCETAGLPYNGENPREVFQAVKSPIGPLSEQDLKKLYLEYFTNCIPSEEMNDLVGYTWRRIYTFNIDDVLRNTQRAKRVQKHYLINALRERRSPWRNFSECQIVQLHGSAEEFENGVIFSREEYAKELHRKSGWYESLGEDFSNHSLLVIGSSLDEPILEYHLSAFNDSYSDAGRSYLITPDQPTEVKKLSLKSTGFVHLEGTLSALVDALKMTFSDGLSPRQIKGSIEVSNRNSVSDYDIEGLRSFFPLDRATVVRNKSFQDASKVSLGRKFYDGYGPDRYTVAMNIPAALRQDAGLDRDVWDEFNRGALGVCLLGESGSGKSTFTYKTLMGTKHAQHAPVYLYKDNATPINAALLALERYLSQENKEFGIVLVDDLHIYAESIGELWSNNRLRRVRVLTSARKSEWHSRIKRALGPDARVLEYQRFEGADIDSLIDQLTANYPSPKFTKLSQEEKQVKFKKSKRQLLVALREATSSEVFDDTIRDEFDRIQSEDGRLLLSIICWATIARVGITKGSCQSIYSKLGVGSSFSAAMSQIDGIVGENSKNRIVARHELFANFIIETLLNVTRLTRSLEAYFDYFSGFEMPIILKMDRLDGQLFKFILGNRNIYRTFDRAGHVKAGSELFERYSIEFQLDGHFWLQYALYLRRLDQQSDALRALETSVDAYQDNVFARHALAQQKLIVASLSNNYGSSEKKLISEAIDELREQHEITSARPWRANSEEYPIVTLANHHIDALYKLGRVEDAREQSKLYFNEIEEFSRSAVSGEYLKSTRERMIKFATLGTWNSPHRSKGQIDFR